LQFIADILSPNYTFERNVLIPLLAGDLAYLKLREVKRQIKLNGYFPKSQKYFQQIVSCIAYRVGNKIDYNYVVGAQ